MSKNKIYYSYSTNPKNINIIIEHTLIYEDIDVIKKIINQFGIEKVKSIWENVLLGDRRLIKLNYFLAKYIFLIKEEDIRDYFLKYSKTRLDKILELSMHK
ncbi:MAG: hypothetical protein RDU14_07090 [Melioribacteraceae bacterium]|nr:hypothetical protein [Melioribacteraceae bacterium]